MYMELGVDARPTMGSDFHSVCREVLTRADKFEDVDVVVVVYKAKFPESRARIGYLSDDTNHPKNSSRDKANIHI